MKPILLAGAVCVALNGCASVQLDPQKPAATTLAPFNAQLGLNRVSVANGSQLAAASIDGKAAFCTLQPAWFALGEARSVCFTDDAKSGYLDHYYVLGTSRSLTYEAHIPYALNGPARPVASVTQASAPMDWQGGPKDARGNAVPTKDAALDQHGGKAPTPITPSVTGPAQDDADVSLPPSQQSCGWLGCIASPYTQAKLNPQRNGSGIEPVGQAVGYAIATAGVPDASVAVGSVTYMTWRRTQRDGGSIYACEETIAVKAGKIAAYRFAGNC
jgi:hypothetical protein